MHAERKGMVARVRVADMKHHPANEFTRKSLRYINAILHPIRRAFSQCTPLKLCYVTAEVSPTGLNVPQNLTAPQAYSRNHDPARLQPTLRRVAPSQQLEVTETRQPKLSRHGTARLNSLCSVRRRAA